MSAPAYLGVIGSARDDTGSVTTLTITVSETLAPDPEGAAVLFLVVAPQNQFGHGDGTLWNSSDPPPITDTVADPGVGGSGNAYEIIAPGSNTGFAYGFGRPLFAVPGQFQGGANGEIFASGAILETVSVETLWGYEIGDEITITLPPGIDGGPVAYAEAVLIAYSTASSPQTEWASRGLDPTATLDGDGGNVPQGDHVFSEFVPAGSSYAAFVAAVNAPTTGDETIEDPSGNWTGVASGSSDDCMGDASGITWTIYTLDGDTVDPTQAIVQFVESVNGVAVSAIVAIFRIPEGGTSPVGIPALNGVIPV